MGIIKRSVSNLAESLSEGTPLFKSKIELCVPEIVLTPSLAAMQVLIILIRFFSVQCTNLSKLY